MLIKFVVDILLKIFFKLLLLSLYLHSRNTFLRYIHLLIDLCLSNLKLRRMNSILVLCTDWDQELVFDGSGCLLLIKIIYFDVFRVLNLLIIIFENKVSEFCSKSANRGIQTSTILCRKAISRRILNRTYFGNVFINGCSKLRQPLFIVLLKFLLYLIIVGFPLVIHLYHSRLSLC